MPKASPITREHMMQLLIEAEPKFEPAWRAFVNEWEGEAKLPLYPALADLARYLIRQLTRGEIARFDTVFDVVERWHTDGDRYVREAATFGLLEDLQNTNLHTRTRPSDFEPWLRPVSKEWWDKVEHFWSKGEPITNA